MELEIAERDCFHLAIGGMVIDPVLVAAEAVARIQHRRMLVGDPRELVEPTAGNPAQAIEVRLQRAKIPWREIKRQQIAEAPIDCVKIML